MRAHAAYRAQAALHHSRRTAIKATRRAGSRHTTRPSPASTDRTTESLKLNSYVADYAETFSHPEVDSSEARQWIGEWMNYLPMSPKGWDDRLGKRSHA